jgi:hypothetical protein
MTAIVNAYKWHWDIPTEKVSVIVKNKAKRIVWNAPRIKQVINDLYVDFDK